MPSGSVSLQNFPSLEHSPIHQSVGLIAEWSYWILWMGFWTVCKIFLWVCGMHKSLNFVTHFFPSKHTPFITKTLVIKFIIITPFLIIKSHKSLAQRHIIVCWYSTSTFPSIWVADCCHSEVLALKAAFHFNCVANLLNGMHSPLSSACYIFMRLAVFNFSFL